MKTKLTVLLALLLLIGSSCRKEPGLNETDTGVSTDFWAYTPKTTKGSAISGGPENHVILRRAMTNLKAMKETKAFEKYVSNLGRPAWDKSTEFADKGKAATLLVPIINDKKKSATALLVVTYVGNHYKYHVVSRGKYPGAKGKNQDKKLMPAESWQRLFNAMDKEFYGKGKSKGFVKKKQDISTKDYVEWEYIGWICWYWCEVDQFDNCIIGTEYGYDCADIYDWVWYDDNGNPLGSEGAGIENGAMSGTEPDHESRDSCYILVLNHWLEDVDEMADTRDTHILFCYSDNISMPLLDLLLMVPEIAQNILQCLESECLLLNLEPLGESLAGFLNDVAQAAENIDDCLEDVQENHVLEFWDRYATFQSDQNWCLTYYP